MWHNVVNSNEWGRCSLSSTLVPQLYLDKNISLQGLERSSLIHPFLHHKQSANQVHALQQTSLQPALS